MMTRFQKPAKIEPSKLKLTGDVVTKKDGNKIEFRWAAIFFDSDLSKGFLFFDVWKNWAWLDDG